MYRIHCIADGFRFRLATATFNFTFNQLVEGKAQAPVVATLNMQLKHHQWQRMLYIVELSLIVLPTLFVHLD
jgi:hypothetical protein